MPDETKSKLREINKGKKHTDEARKKISEASKEMWRKRKERSEDQSSLPE